MMEQWASDIWIAIAAAFIVGAVLGAILVLAFNSNVRKQHELEQTIKQAKADINEKINNLRNILNNPLSYFPL